MKTTLPKLKKKAQDKFNAWIRNRDKDKGCISCGASIDHAGHYFSAGHHSALTMDEMNVHGQCLRCNNFLHGNLIKYRMGLISRYGESHVIELESKSVNAVKKWSRQELEEIILKYK
tara:strand:- start:472 stop:822 length:351 start_codon:yes stop_codon:yes gene_type:complete